MSRPLNGRGANDDPRGVEPGADGRPVAVEEQRVVTKPARTSAAAAFALAFGVAAFVCVLIVILFPTTSRSRNPDSEGDWLIRAAGGIRGGGAVRGRIRLLPPR
ncbi:hypothetical protein E143388_08305 [Rhodococcus opacus]|nr:hypothetical protein E143388_08305 [Rhodococcus opacus]